MLNNDFKEFVELLNSNGVEYLVVGGYALASIRRMLSASEARFCFRCRVADPAPGRLSSEQLASGRAKDLADLESLDTPPEPDPI